MPVKTHELFDLNHTLAAQFLSRFTYPWEALEGLKNCIISLQKTLDLSEFDEIFPLVFAHKTAKICPSAHIIPPAIIGENTEIRHCAFIRGSALIGKNCVVGNSTEVKNSVLFDGVQVPHFNYVGDSILGFKAHMGAGAITSNVKSDRSQICIKSGQNEVKTGLKKLGAIIGDGVEVGCNSVLNPGTVIGKNSRIYPLSNVRGIIPPNTLYKSAGEIVKIHGV
ncbi:MAG: UDP-N-acetylglucosamine pyrophosphorylase [Clostridia bacterium]|nr:UDP-N-acetylglucosamine pyrophosphorylase [Clostridia bacterium]